MNGTTFYVCLISAFSALKAASSLHAAIFLERISPRIAVGATRNGTKLRLVSDKEVIKLISTLCGKNASTPTIKLRMGKQIDVVQKYTATPRTGWTRSRTRGVRVDNVPRHTTLQILREIQKWIGELNCTPEFFLRELYLCRCSTTSFGEISRTNSLVWKIQQW